MQLTTLLDMAVEGAGDRVVAGRRADGFTARDLAARADVGARLIRERDAGALIYLAVNGPAFPVALFAAARADLPLVPLNSRLGQEQLDDLLARHPGAIALRHDRRARPRKEALRAPSSELLADPKRVEVAYLGEGEAA